MVWCYVSTSLLGVVLVYIQMELSFSVASYKLKVLLVSDHTSLFWFCKRHSYFGFLFASCICGKCLVVCIWKEFWCKLVLALVMQGNDLLGPESLNGCLWMRLRLRYWKVIYTKEGLPLENLHLCNMGVCLHQETNLVLNFFWF